MSDATEEPDRVADLVLAFTRWAKQAAAAMDERLDFKEQGNCVSKMNAITASLDALPPHYRTALAPLLDDADVDIRARAAAYLLKTTRERALAVLRQIDEEHGGTHAGSIAMRWLFRHKLGEV